jgi:hypothetical protein
VELGRNASFPPEGPASRRTSSRLISFSAIDIREGEAGNEAALKDLIRAAVALNL